MNIFVLSLDVAQIPKHYCDLHLRKMMIEYVQLLSNTWPESVAPYKRTHYNHPCSKWVRESRANYIWLYQLVNEMDKEYQKRFNKQHLSASKLKLLRWENAHLPNVDLTPWPQCMPKEFKVFHLSECCNYEFIKNRLPILEDSPYYNTIHAYRRYYADKLKQFRKRGICKFTKPSGATSEDRKSPTRK